MLTTIPSETLRQLVKLSERKEGLMAQIQEIDRRMIQLERPFEVAPGASAQRGRVTFSAAPPKKRRSRRRAQRGALKAKIVGALRKAGKRGATIRELSDKLGVRAANLYVWFNGTGRNVRGLRKVGTARYRLR
jgi:hypothetical protein